MTKLMLAAVCTNYGGPEVIQIQKVAVPVIKTNEVLVKVHAAVVGPSDCAFRSGDPFIIKLMYGLSKPRIQVQGVEFAGEIAAIGSEVTNFKAGDQVFGMSPNKMAAHAQYIAVAENSIITHKPTSLTYAQSVGIADGAPTALVFLRDTAKIKSGQKILINGASGAVGLAAVQLAKYFGATVTATTSAANFDLVKSIGADYVIDYHHQDFTMSKAKFDIVFDAVGKSTFDNCRNILPTNGIYMTTVPNLSTLFAILKTRFARQKAKFTAAGLNQTSKNFEFLRQLVEERKLKPTIDREYSLAEIAEAHRYVETDHKKGNVVIRIPTITY